MARRIPEWKKRIAYRLYKNEGFTGNEIVKTLQMSAGATWVATVGKDRGYSSIKAHLDYLAQQQINPDTGAHFIGHREYEVYLVKQRINSQTRELFTSHVEYSKHLAKKRKRRKDNKAFSEFIDISLDVLGQSVSWLAEKTNLGETTIWQYVEGKSLPSNYLLPRIFAALEAPYKTIDDLIKDPNNSVRGLK